MEQYCNYYIPTVWIVSKSYNYIFGTFLKYIDYVKRTLKQWKGGEIKGVEAMKMLKMTKATFYRRVKEYEDR